MVFCIATPKATYHFIQQCINHGLTQALFLGLSSAQIIQQLLKESRGIDIVVSSFLPNPETSKAKIADKYRKASLQFLRDIPFSPFYFEGFLCMEVLKKCLYKIQGTFTINKMIKALKDFFYKDVDNIVLRYNKTTRSISQQIWINPGIQKKWIKSSQKQTSPRNKNYPNKQATSPLSQ